MSPFFKQGIHQISVHFRVHIVDVTFHQQGRLLFRIVRIVETGLGLQLSKISAQDIGNIRIPVPDSVTNLLFLDEDREGA